MATDNKKKGAQKEIEVQEIVSRSEKFIENHSKKIAYGILAIAVVIGIFMGVRHGYLEPREQKATKALFKGEMYFAQDSFALALNGNGADYLGFATIASDFSGTDAGNLAKAYAGICYYKLGDKENALKNLKSFKANDLMVAPTMIGLIGDCYVAMDNTKEAISYFEKAAKAANNPAVSPIYLKKAGIAYESLNQYKEAVKAYTTIKEKYYGSQVAADIDKYIARANASANK